MFFLFSDMLLQAKRCSTLLPASGDRFVGQCAYPLLDCTVEKVFGHTKSQGGLLSVSQLIGLTTPVSSVFTSIYIHPPPLPNQHQWQEKLPLTGTKLDQDHTDVEGAFCWWTDGLRSCKKKVRIPDKAWQWHKWSVFLHTLVTHHFKMPLLFSVDSFCWGFLRTGPLVQCQAAQWGQQRPWWSWPEFNLVCLVLPIERCRRQDQIKPQINP